MIITITIDTNTQLLYIYCEIHNKNYEQILQNI